jgi:hypothetical protein
MNKIIESLDSKLTSEEINSHLEEVMKFHLERKKNQQREYLNSKKELLIRKIRNIEQEMSIIFDFETLEEIQRHINITEKEYE